jgi:S-DNA-T family DNA segregation ATPase FtsK/SpoIIIE
LNLFLQDYIGKTGNSFDFDFGLIIYVIFKLKLSQKESILFENKKEIKTDLGSMELYGLYNLEEFAITDEKKELILLVPKPSNLKSTKKL